MQSEDIKKRLQEVETRCGRWLTENIQLVDDIYTIGPPRRPSPGWPFTGHEGVDPRARCFVQAAADLLGQPLNGLRVLDMGPGEGLFATEFARQGAQVVAFAAAEACRERLKFFREVFALENLEIVADDIRQLQPDKHGSFDVVLCAGVLDQLDSLDFFPVMKQAADVCRRVMLIDTHVSLADREAYVHQGVIYWGRTVQGWMPATDGTSHGPPFWLTRPSLYNLLRNVGFTSVFECHIPMGFVFADRHLFAALRGRRQTITSLPLLNEPEEEWPEKPHLSAHPVENADVYHTHEEVVANYEHLRAEYDTLFAQHAKFTYLGGILRELPRAVWQAVRRRLPGKKGPEAPPHGQST